MPDKPKAVIMYIEDEVDAIQNMMEFLVPRDYCVLVAVSAEKGWELLKKYTPDIILVDIKLIGKSGVEFIRRIREAGIEIPVIVITAYPGSIAEIEAEGLGIHCFCIKPFSFADLFRHIKEILEIV